MHKIKYAKDIATEQTKLTAGKASE